MRRYELELIAALAEGSLEDESEARALVDSSTEHRAEFEAQKAAIDAMRSVPPARLTETERSALHRDVWTALTSQPAAAKKAPWYYRWSYAAAGVLVVAVGLTAVLNQGDADDTGTVAFEETGQGLTGGDDGATDPSDAAAGQSADELAPQADAQTDSFLSLFRDRASRTRTGELAAGAILEGSEAKTFAEEHASCVLQAELDDFEAIGEITVSDAREFGLDSDHPYLVAIPAGEELSDGTPVAFIEMETCSLVHLDE